MLNIRSAAQPRTTALPPPIQDFCTGCGNGLPGFAAGDVGIIVLSEPVPTNVVSEYAELPDEGLVDSLKNKTPVDFVGYGVQEQRRGGGPTGLDGTPSSPLCPK